MHVRRHFESPLEFWDHHGVLNLPPQRQSRAWDEQVGPRYRAGEPAPGMSRERFLRLLTRRKDDVTTF
jgi:hypothetical protein